MYLHTTRTKIFGMGTDYDAHKMVLYQGLFFWGVENKKFLMFKKQIVLS